MILWENKQGNATIYHPVIIDYGLAQLVPKDRINKSGFCLVPMGRIGKDYYHPLETIGETIHRPLNPFACDMWQMGILLLIMVSGKPPFNKFDDRPQTFSFYKNVRFENYSAVFHNCKCEKVSEIYPQIFNIFKCLVKKEPFPPEDGVSGRLTALETLSMCIDAQSSSSHTYSSHGGPRGTS